MSEIKKFGELMDKSIFETQWQSISSETSLDLLNSSKKGLSQEEIKIRREIFGPNKLPETKKKNKFLIFIEQFNDLLIFILLGGVIVSLLLAIVEVDTYSELTLEHFLDAIVIGIVLLFNAFIGFYQEIKAEKEVASLKSLISTESTVIRDGKKKRIIQENLVIGDIIELEAGQKVPADARLIESTNLQTIESSLTGESIPIEKNTTKIITNNVSLGDKVNMVFMGTTISFGKALAVVTAIGIHTEVGKIASLMSSIESSKTPLQQRLEVFGKQLGVGTLVLAGIMIIFGFLAEFLSSDGSVNLLKTLLDLIILGVSLVVAAVPEGLPAVMVLVLALGIRRMAQQHTISKSLQAIESIGSTTFICTDKTGTLTQNKMTVSKIVTVEEQIQVDEIQNSDILPDVESLLQIALIANNAVLIQDESNQKNQEIGDALDIAILKTLNVLKEKNIFVLNQTDKFVELPFDSNRKRMSVITKKSRDNYSLYTKGAPDLLLDICTKYIDKKGNELEIDQAIKDQLTNVIKELSSEGLKVIGCGYSTLNNQEVELTKSEKFDFNKIEKDLVFAGFLCLIDPPRIEVFDAIAACKTAGIDVMMITGDHPNTALAIGQQINLISKDDTNVITGIDIDKMDEKHLLEKLEDTRILARVSPEHKLQVVKLLQQKGHIVAMTGDGVNDAPALRQADIGVAMGQSGTEAASEASDLILTDDNFATLVKAIEEGRSIQSNIRKFIGYLLASNTGEVLLLMLTVFIIGFITPSLIVELSVLNESQILYMNLVTDTFLAIAIGLEGKNLSIMKDEPKSPKEPIINKNTLLSILYTGTYVSLINLTFFLILLGDPSKWMLLTHNQIAYAQTMTMSLIIFMETFIALSYRSTDSIFSGKIFSNKVFILSFLTVYAFHFAIIYVPFLRLLFGLVTLNLIDWFILISLSLIALFLEEFRKKMLPRNIYEPRSNLFQPVKT